MFQTIPTDWPRRVKMAAKATTDERARRTLAAEVLVLLRRNDPMGLRAKGLDAAQREAHYASQVDALIQAAA